MIPLLDTHQHLIYPDRLGYAWTADIPALAGASFTLEDYHRLTADKNVVGSVFMETAADDADYQDEARFVAELASDPASNIRGLIVSCRPEIDDGFDAWLDECADLPVVGFRRILHVFPDETSRADGFRRNVRKIGDRGLTYDLCFLAKQLPVALKLAQACDNTSLVLDHCGVPDIAGGGMDPWREHIAALAALPHVSCKVSGVLAYCAEDAATIDAVRPFVDHIVSTFPSDRLVWGSDWPVVNMASDMPRWIDIFSELVGGLSDDEAKAIGHRNAERIYGVGS